MSILHAILSFIVAISILVGIHEFGHFWVARKLGVKVLCFSIGFGKPLYQKERNGVLYKIGLIPLGGYVKMLDEREAPVPVELRPLAFNTQSVGKRAAIVAAGPAANFLFAIVAYSLVFMIGITGIKPILGEVEPNSPAALSQLKASMEIRSINDKPVLLWEDVILGVLNHIGSSKPLIISAHLPGEEPKTFAIDTQNWNAKDSDNPVSLLGLKVNLPPIPPIVGSLMSGEAGEASGLMIDDTILSVDGAPVKDWGEFIQILRHNPNTPLEVSVLRQNDTKVLTLTPRAKGASKEAPKENHNAQGAAKGNAKAVGFAGIGVKPIAPPEEMMLLVRYNPLVSLQKGIQKTWDYSISSLILIGKMLTLDLSPKQLSGPISIAKFASTSFTIGLTHFISFLALVSISLGVMNLLPIPVLDGGHLFFYLIEFLRGGKPIPQRFQEWGLNVGVLILVGIMCIAFYNDVHRML